MIDGVLPRPHPALLCASSPTFWSKPTIGWPTVEGQSVSAPVACGAALHVPLPLSTTNAARPVRCFPLCEPDPRPPTLSHPDKQGVRLNREGGGAGKYPRDTRLIFEW